MNEMFEIKESGHIYQQHFKRFIIELANRSLCRIGKHGKSRGSPGYWSSKERTSAFLLIEKSHHEDNKDNNGREWKHKLLLMYRNVSRR